VIQHHGERRRETQQIEAWNVVRLVELHPMNHKGREDNESARRLRGNVAALSPIENEHVFRTKRDRCSSRAMIVQVSRRTTYSRAHSDRRRSASPEASGGCPLNIAVRSFAVSS
jgi:hypothetical protein